MYLDDFFKLIEAKSSDKFGDNFVKSFNWTAYYKPMKSDIHLPTV